MDELQANVAAAAQCAVISLVRKVLAAFTCDQTDRRPLLKAARSWLLQELLATKDTEITMGALLVEVLGLLLRQAQIRYILPYIALSAEPCSQRSKSKKKTVETVKLSEGGDRESPLFLTKYQIKNLCKVSRGMILSLTKQELKAELDGNIPGNALELLLLAQSAARSGKWCDVNAPLCTLETLLGIAEAVVFTLAAGQQELLLEGLARLPFDQMAVWSTAMKIVASFGLSDQIDPATTLPLMMAHIPIAKLYSKVEQAGELLPMWHKPLLVVLAGGGPACDGIQPSCKIRVKTLRKLVTQWGLACDQQILELTGRAEVVQLLATLAKESKEAVGESREKWSQVLSLAAGREDLEEYVGRAIMAAKQPVDQPLGQPMSQGQGQGQDLSPRHVFQCMQRALDDTNAAHKAQIETRGQTAITSRCLLEGERGVKSITIMVPLRESRGADDAAGADESEPISNEVPVTLLQSLLQSTVPVLHTVLQSVLPVPVLILDTAVAAHQFLLHVESMRGAPGPVYIAIDCEWSNVQPLSTVQIACRSPVPSQWGRAALAAGNGSSESSSHGEGTHGEGMHECVYIVDMLAQTEVTAITLPATASLLNSPGLTKLGFSPAQDVARLKASGLRCDEDITLVDLQAVFGVVWPKRAGYMPGSQSVPSTKKGSQIPQQFSLKRVVQATLGQEIDKTEQCSAWDQRPLSCSQVEYAALDAHCLLQIWDALRAE
jgi:hypothetical protein